MKLETQMHFAHNLKTLRINRSLSQTELAKALNISRTAYSQYESGGRFPDMEILIDISEFFGVKIDALFHSADSKILNDMEINGLMSEIEHDLIHLFLSLSDYSKGKLLERAHILHEEEKKYLQGIRD